MHHHDQNITTFTDAQSSHENKLIGIYPWDNRWFTLITTFSLVILPFAVIISVRHYMIQSLVGTALVLIMTGLFVLAQWLRREMIQLWYPLIDWHLCCINHIYIILTMRFMRIRSLQWVPMAHRSCAENWIGSNSHLRLVDSVSYVPYDTDTG